MPMSAHWQQKMRTYFKRIDFDGDGKITRADFEGMAERFVNTGHLSGDMATNLTTNLTKVWDDYLSKSGLGGGLAVGDFVTHMEKVVGDTNMKVAIEGPLPLFFQCVDGNNDGKIDRDEFKLFFEILGLDVNMAGATFDAIDLDKDGLLTVEEFTAAGSEFFFKDDASLPTQVFWGPLV